MQNGKTLNKPDFIGIGPPKTGTTWIYENLKKHPQVAMPPDKEIRYFWERAFIGNLTYVQRFKSEHWHVRGRRFYLKKRFKAHLADSFRFKLDLPSLNWDLRYLLWKQTDDWYSQLFSKTAISGDITAKYCELPEAEIARIKANFPHLKILITLRDPIEREWSRAKMNLCKKRNRHISEVSEEEFVAQFNDPPQFKSNDYKKLIQVWKDQFSSNQILILFYDELLENPFGYYCKICDFLQIERPTREQEDRLKEFVFKGVKGEIPTHMKEILIGMHKENILNLSDYLPNETYPKRWLQQYLRRNTGVNCRS